MPVSCGTWNAFPGYHWKRAYVLFYLYTFPVLSLGQHPHDDPHEPTMVPWAGRVSILFFFLYTARTYTAVTARRRAAVKKKMVVSRCVLFLFLIAVCASPTPSTSTTTTSLADRNKDDSTSTTTSSGPPDDTSRTTTSDSERRNLQQDTAPSPAEAPVEQTASQLIEEWKVMRSETKESSISIYSSLFIDFFTLDNSPTISIQTTAPTSQPSPEPSANPTDAPTSPPTTRSPTPAPTPSPTRAPTPSPTPQRNPEQSVTSFLVIADVPYTSREATDLIEQMRDIPSNTNALFMVHVGDLRNARDGRQCTLSEFTSVADTLKLSPAPVLVLPGDNEWNDCPNMATAISQWRSTFVDFESAYWNPVFQVRRMPGYPESFTFLLRGTLFIGLNIVGGAVQSSSEWSSRLTSEANWTMELMRNHRGTTVIFGHADPSSRHGDFFNRIRNFLLNEYDERIPVIYINGDDHQWRFQRNFYGVPNWTRITLTGGTSEPPLYVTVDSRATMSGSFLAFDRGL